jgi:hypothetical protein
LYHYSSVTVLNKSSRRKGKKKKATGAGFFNLRFGEKL